MLDYYICSQSPNYLCEVKESPVNNYFKGFVYYEIAATTLIIILTLLIGIICSCFVISKKKVLFMTFSCIWLYIAYTFQFYKEPQLCSFPYKCSEHPTSNNTIITENYYYQMMECPRENAWLIDYYMDDHNKEYDCPLSTYGCCKVPTENIVCTELMNDSYLQLVYYSDYLDYKEQYHGFWSLTIDSNQDMSNCPSFPEILYSISHNNLFNNLVNKNSIPLIISTVFIVFVTIISYKENKEKEYTNLQVASA